MDEKILSIVVVIQQQLESIQQQINVMQEDIDTLKQDVAELKQDVSSLKQDVEYLKKQRIQDRKDMMEAFYNLEINIQRAIDEATKPNKEAIEYNAKINSLDHENYDSKIRKLEFVSNTCKN